MSKDEREFSVRSICANLAAAAALATTGCTEEADPDLGDAGEVLLGAMSGDEAEQARSLLADVEFVKVDSGHSVHSEKTDEFVQIVLDFESRLQP